MFNGINNENFNIFLLALPVIGLLVGYAIGMYRRRAIENSGEALLRCLFLFFELAPLVYSKIRCLSHKGPELQY
jgi:uncharacterized membrane protein YoaK (UPF0700 family)